MSNENMQNPNPSGADRTTTMLKWAVVILSVLLVILIGVLIAILVGDRSDVNPTVPSTSQQTTPTGNGSTAPSGTDPIETTVPEETEPLVMLDVMAALYEENEDIAGWLKIDGTVIDYPVVFTPDDPEEYLRKNFNGFYSISGTLFIDGNCSIRPESDNIIIYGHNMQNGSMFSALMKYQDETFWKEHPEIYYSTLYEERTYEVVAAFYDRVYYSYEDVFKFYQFIDAESEEHFQEAMNYYKNTALYDTGITAEYGDKLITLVTCSYHEEYGRFVVVAREKTEPEA